MNLQRQLEELEAVKAVFPEPGAVTLDTRLPQAAPDFTGKTELLTNISGRVLLLDTLSDARPVGITFVLPATYPDVAPDLQVICEGGRQVLDELTRAVQSCVQDNIGSEMLLPVLQALQDKYAELGVNSQTLSEPLGHHDDVPATSKESQAHIMSRMSIWFHHIKSTTKRKNIVAWARELGVRGFSKPGFPGIIVCEGLQDDLQEYLGRVKAMKWQAMAVRAEELDAEVHTVSKVQWHFPVNFQELEESDMDVLAAQCKSAGLEHLIRAALKLPQA